MELLHVDQGVVGRGEAGSVPGGPGCQLALLKENNAEIIDLG